MFKSKTINHVILWVFSHLNNLVDELTVLVTLSAGAFHFHTAPCQMS